MSGLQENEIQQYREVFNIFDADRSGFIDSKELKSALVKMGYKPSDEDVAQMISEVDSDKSGTIDWNEFVKSMAKKPEKKRKEAELRAAFKQIDKDGSGDLDASELRALLEAMDLSKYFTDTEIQDMVKAADVDGDGKIQYEEFLRLWS